MKARIDGFSGPDHEYIRYLERKVVSLRRRHSCCQYNTSNEPSTEPFSFANASQRQQQDASGLQLDRSLQLNFVYWNSSSLPVATATIPAWKQLADKLIRETPQADRWSATLQDSGIDDIMRDGKAVSYLLDITAEAREPTLGLELYDGPLSHIKRYAYSAAHRETMGSSLLLLANFQKFLVFSLCAVLRDTGVPITELYYIIRICSGKISDEHCWRILLTAKYLNKLIDSLYMQGWGLRGRNRPPVFFIKLASSADQALEYFKIQLGQEKFVHGVGDGPWPGIFVPNLIYQILGKSLHVARIGQILGYKYAHFFEEEPRVNPWYYMQ